MKKDTNAMRHSAAHLLAASVQKLFPGTHLGIGPVIEDGFYYDFESQHKFSPLDFPKIEKQINNLKKQNIPFKKVLKTVPEAKKLMKSLSEPYKLELIDNLENEGVSEISFYQTGDFIDLCSGPHLENSSQVGEVKILSVAGAYWQGSEKNKMLQRLYGTAWHDKKDLELYLEKVKSRQENDHRKLGKELDLFVFSDLVGKGLPLLTSKGSTLRRELENFVRDQELKQDYEHVYTPPLAKTDLYKKSGHYPFYKDTMYQPMKVDEEELILRPMTCPHHFMLYKSRQRSYRELPIKYAEISPQFRYEKSGELLGLSRVRVFNLTDAHIFCTKEQVEKEIQNVLDMIISMNEKIGFKKGEDYHFRLSLGDGGKSKKYYQDSEEWGKAEDFLRNSLKSRRETFSEAADEAAFYGPKIDIQMKNTQGKEETVFTIQYDFVMPKRFDLSYINNLGKSKELIVIHRSSIGAIERVMSFLIEKTRGEFPLWLAPIQVIVIPIAERHINYGLEIKKKLVDKKLRVQVDDDSDTMQSKIRRGQIQKIPYILIVGDKEKVQKQVSVRQRGEGDIGIFDIDDFMRKILAEVSNKI